MLPTLLGAVVFLAMMAGLFVPLEAMAPARPTSPTRKSTLLGAGLFVLNTLLMQALGAPVLELLGAGRATRSVALFGLVFFAADLVGYWVHRAMHRVPFLWRFHRLHHEAAVFPPNVVAPGGFEVPPHVVAEQGSAMHWLDAWRQHPVDFVLHGIAVGVPGALLGASLSELASVVVLRKAFTTFLHANVKVDFGLVLASPVFHATHHSADPRDHDTNFAGTFPLWDVLFGTSRTAGDRVSTQARKAQPEPAPLPATVAAPPIFESH